jgi:putative MATE family efflux protein
VRNDILEGSLWSAVPLFALPVAATSILEQLNNLIDVVMIGHFSPDGASLGMAAVGANTSLVSLLINLFVGIAIGTNVVVAHAVGAGDEKTVHRAVHTSVLLAALGLVAIVVGEPLSEPLLRLLQVPDETLPEALVYLRIFLLGMPSVLLYNFEAAVFRSVGITRMPLFALTLSAALNVVLDGIFVAVLGLGAAGVATATVICYTASAVFLLFMLLRAEPLIRLNPRDLRIDPAIAREIVRIGMPAGSQGAIFSLANVVIQSCVNSLGTLAMAGSSAALSVEYVLFSLLGAFGQTCTTFVGQCDGAGNLPRCRKVFRVCVIEGMVVTAGIIAVAVFGGRAIVALFNSDPEVIEVAYLRLVMIVPAYVFSTTYDNCAGYMRGFGISLVPAALTVAGVCGIRVFWSFVVFPANPTFFNLMLVYPISLGVTAVLLAAALIAYRRRGAIA